MGIPVQADPLAIWGREGKPLKYNEIRLARALFVSKTYHFHTFSIGGAYIIPRRTPLRFGVVRESPLSARGSAWHGPSL